MFEILSFFSSLFPYQHPSRRTSPHPVLLFANHILIESLICCFVHPAPCIPYQSDRYLLYNQRSSRSRFFFIGNHTMRAYHMPSLPEMPLEHLHGGDPGIAETKPMKLKVLYSLDDNTNFLARSVRLSGVKTARIPIPGQQNIMTLGAVSIKDALEPVFNSSPELFSDAAWDYSVYVKDIAEEDEPFVGHGLISKLVNDDPFEEEVLVPGRVCSNFTALLSSKTPSETLEIKLRFAKVRRQESVANYQTSTPQPQQTQQRSDEHQQQQQQQQQQQHQNSTQSKINSKKTYRRSSLSLQQKEEKESSDTENEYDDNEQPKFLQPKNPQPHPQQSVNIMPKMTRFVNNNPAPKAARTQSLPVFENMMKPPQSNGKPIETFPVNSIPLRIYMADKSGKNSNNQKFNNVSSSNDYNQASVAKRFASDFIKTSNSSHVKDSKKKVRKTSITATPSYAATNTSVSKVKKSEIPEEHQLYQSCFNCKTLEAKGWKWNESEDLSKRGLLCSLCYTYLRDKGVMRPKRLFSKTTKTRDRSKGNMSSSSPSSNVGNDTTPATTPIRFYNNGKNSGLPSSSYMDNSSDSLNGFDDMINDLDFQYGPLTDIDPLPPHEQQVGIADKENVPPQKQTSIALQLQEYHEQRSRRQQHQQQQQQRQQQQQQHQQQHQHPLHHLPQQELRQPSPVKATKQTSFEKMLTKSFSGIIPNTTNELSPSEWMNTFFAEPTPKDQTPKDSPKDMTTCNTLPCNEESPGLTPNINDLKNNNDISKLSGNKMKVTTMPSSPFLTSQEGDELLPIGGSSSPRS